MTTQGVLPGIAFAPRKVRLHGLSDAHTYPLVSPGKRAGLPMRSWRVPAARAWEFPSLELRAANSWPVLVLDCDYDFLVALLVETDYRQSLPRPNWVVLRDSNGHGHAVWCLERPVHRPCAARADVRLKPMQKWARISEYFAGVLRADRGYNGVLTHNPMSRPQGRELSTRWLRKGSYGLAQLGEYVPVGWRRPKLLLTAAGRNCALFEACMRWAGSVHNLGLPVLDVAMALNARLEPPLGDNELQGIVKSVERYRTAWMAQGRFYAQDHSPGLQRVRGIKSGKARRAAVADRDRAIVALAAEGWSQRAIARAVGVSKTAVRHVLQRDRQRPLLGGL